MAEPRVIIVGAGPAGVRAAEALVAAGLRPTVVDEGRRDGGQIYRRQPEGFSRSSAELYGTEAARADALHATFDDLRPKIDYRPGHLAWNVSDGQLHVVHDGSAEALPFDALIVASGATDRLMPVKGWQHAGVYSLGAAQIALKSQGCGIGRRVVFLGTGPLMQLVAAQYRKAGAQVVALLDTSRLWHQISALPKLASRPDVLAKGVVLAASHLLAGTMVRRGVTPVEIFGDADGGVSGVIVRLASGRDLRLACDAVALGYHLRPETQLADLAGCDFAFDAATRQFWPVIDEDGRSSVPGIYLAGDGVRTQGADGAEIAGKLAALAVLTDRGRSAPTEQISRLRQQRRAMERFRTGISEAFPWPHHLAAGLADDTVVCRCEGITAGELRAVVHDKGADEMNRAKALSRVGMGRCQGRYCGHAAAEVVAAATQLSPAVVGRLRGQAPVKPLAIRTRRAAP
jgi:NADPH-dependent 2,4-dienoyl-CoA reductase/sulfur reductase-like enzyme